MVFLLYFNDLLKALKFISIHNISSKREKIIHFSIECRKRNFELEIKTQNLW